MRLETITARHLAGPLAIEIGLAVVGVERIQQGHAVWFQVLRNTTGVGFVIEFLGQGYRELVTQGMAGNTDVTAVITLHVVPVGFVQ